jgi:hypothetical protein
MEENVSTCSLTELVCLIKTSMDKVEASREYISCGCDEYCYHDGSHAFDDYEMTALSRLITELNRRMIS